MWNIVWNEWLPHHSISGEAVPGATSEKSRQAAEGAGAAGPQGALQPGHLGAAHQGRSKESGGGLSGGGELQQLFNLEGEAL